MATTVGNVIFQISADLKNVQGQLRTLEGNFQSSFSRIEGIAKSFGNGLLQGIIGGLSIGALTGFGKEILNLADNLQNLSDQTHVSVELLSGIKSPLEEAGTSMDAFAKGVFNLQKNLGNVDDDSDKVAQSIKRLGLNLDDLRNSSPDDFIKKVTDALATIENPLERNTLLFNLLGKSAKELGPAFQQLVGHFDELRAKGLTAADVKALDDVGDALTRLKNQALILGAEGVANILRFYGALRDVPNIGGQLDSATQAAARVFNLPKGRVEAMSSKEIIAQAEQSPEPLRRSAREARDQVLNLREEFNKLNAVNIKGPVAAFKGIGDAAKKAAKDTAIDDFFAGLQKQIETIDLEFVKLRDGDKIAKEIALDLQFADFNAKRVAEGKPIASIEEFRKYKEVIVEANAELEKLRANKELVELTQTLSIKAIDTSTPQGKETARIASIEVEFAKTAKKIEELGKAAGLTQEEIAGKVALAWKGALNDITQTAREQFKQLDDQFKGLQKTLAIDILPQDQQGAARAGQEFEDRIKSINEWHDAAIAAGKDVEQVNAEAAQATADAWVVASGKMKETIDEQSEFTRRAFERGFDVIANTFEDFLNNGFKNFKDFGKKILGVINSLLADQLTLQLKQLVLGEDFGKKGAPIGGILGDLLGIKKPEAKQIPGTTAADTLDQERGKELRDAAGILTPASTQFSTATTQFAAAVAQFASAAGISSGGQIAPVSQGQIFSTFPAPVNTDNSTITEVQQGDIFNTFPAAVAKVADQAVGQVKAAGTVAEKGIEVAGETMQAGFGDFLKDAFKNVFSVLATGELPGGVGGRGTQTVGFFGNEANQVGADQVAASTESETQAAITQSTIEALSVEATTAIQAESTAGTAAIELSSATGETAITTLGSATEAAILALQEEAIAAIETAGAGSGGDQGPLGGIPIIGSLFSSFGGGASGGAAGGASGGFGEIIDAGSAFAHQGGSVDANLPIRRYHDGGMMGGGKVMAQPSAAQTGLKPGERMIIAEDGEFVFSKEAVRQIGLPKLEKANEMKQLWPKYHDGGTVRPIVMVGGRPLQSIQLSHSAQTTLNRFHAGGAIGSQGDRESSLHKIEYFHQGGTVRPEIRYATNVERYHDGGAVSLVSGWSNPGSDMAYMSPLAMPQNAMMPAAKTWTGDTSGGFPKVEVNINGATNPEEFRRNQATIFSGVYRAVRKGMKYD